MYLNIGLGLISRLNYDSLGYSLTKIKISLKIRLKPLVLFQMPMFYKAKPTTRVRQKVSAQVMEAAVREVVEDGVGIRKTASKFNIDKMTLHRYVKKFNSRPQEDPPAMEYVPNYKKL